MIFYFSGTGNTRWAAKQIAEAIDDTLYFIPTELKANCSYTLKPGERIGFFFPVHGWMPPRIVRNFIKRVSFNGFTDNYVYALCSCGDDIGMTMKILRSDLKKKKLPLNASFSITMPETYVCLPFFNLDNTQKAIHKIKSAKESLDLFAEAIISKKEVDFTHKGSFAYSKTFLLGIPFNKWLITDNPFHVNSDVCVTCGKCFRTCPTENIIWQKGTVPNWRRKNLCSNCLACYHVCPRKAINYGNHTLNKGQYFFDNFIKDHLPSMINDTD